MSNFVRRIDPHVLKHMRREFGEMTIDECVELAQQADDYKSAMTVFDPAYRKFQQDSRRWWEYAWLLSCEFGSFGVNDPYVKWYAFLVSFPQQQLYIEHGEYKSWLVKNTASEIVTEFAAALPVYLRPDEVLSYAELVFMRQNEIEGKIVGFDIIELEQKEG